MTQKLLRGRYQVVPRVLCFVLRGDQVLLLRGAPDKKIWPGRYNGVGGHVEADEDILCSARREILEETGLTIENPVLRGVVNIQTSTPETGILLFVLTASTDRREVVSSPEGTLEWVPLHRVPELPVVPDVPILLDRALQEDTKMEPFFASYHYEPGGRLAVTFAA